MGSKRRAAEFARRQAEFAQMTPAQLAADRSGLVTRDMIRDASRRGTLGNAAAGAASNALAARAERAGRGITPEPAQYRVDDGRAEDFINPRVPAAKGYRLQGEMGMSPGAGFDSLEAERDQLTQAANEYGGAVMEKNLPRILAINQYLNGAPTAPGRTVRRADQSELDRMGAELQSLYGMMDRTRDNPMDRPAYNEYVKRAEEIARNIENNTADSNSVSFDPNLPYKPGPTFEESARAAKPDWQNNIDDWLTTSPLGQFIAPILGGGVGVGSATGVHMGIGNADRPLPPNPNDYSGVTPDAIRSGQDYQQKPMGNLRESSQNQGTAVVQGPGGVLNNPGTLNTNGNWNPVTGAGTAAPGSGAAPLVPGSPLANGPHTGVNAGNSPLRNVSQNGGGLTAGTPVAAGTAGAVADGMGGWVLPAAIAGSAAINAATGIYQGNKIADAEAAAAAARNTAEGENRQLIRDMFTAGMDREKAIYDQQRGDLAPWREAGVNALAGLTTFDQNNPMPEVAGPFQFNTTGPNADPSYTFRFNEGRKALENSYASRGGLLGGNALRGITNYGQEAASQEYGNAFNRYMQSTGNRFNQQSANRGAKLNAMQSLAGVGQSAVQQTNQAAQQYGNSASQMGQNYTTGVGNSMINGANAMGQGGTNAANARASGYIGAAGALTSGLGQYLNQQSGNAMMERMMPWMRGGY